MNRKSEANELRDAFENLSDKEIQQLKKQAQADHIDQEELDIIAEEIGNKMGRRIQLSSSYTPDVDPLAKNLDSLLLHREITESAAKKQKQPLLHQHKRGDELYKRLYQWHKFNDPIEPFIKPVQYCVFSQQRQTIRSTASTVSHSPLTLSNKELHVAVQDRLVESHHEKLSLLTPELVEPLERVLDASLIKLVIVKDMATLFFEWGDPMPFVFVMAFTLFFTESAPEKLARHTVITLHRKDIMEFDDAEATELNEVKQKQKKVVGKKKKVVFNPLLDMEEDEEEEAHSNEPMKYMDTLNIEEEHKLRSFIECIRASSISYLTCAYVKRD